VLAVNLTVVGYSTRDSWEPIENQALLVNPLLNGFMCRLRPE
jgi:hypothetical protein